MSKLVILTTFPPKAKKGMHTVMQVCSPETDFCFHIGDLRLNAGIVFISDSYIEAKRYVKANQ
jgi:hypothetical protein